MYPRIQLNPSDLFIRHFVDIGSRARSSLDAFVTGLGIPPFLAPETAKAFKWPGKAVLFSKISSENWRTDSIRTTKDHRLEMLDPRRHFSIHLEVRVQMWNGVLALLLFYEPRPCYSQQTLISKLDAESLRQYYGRRNAFFTDLALRCRVQGFKLSIHPQQIGRAELRLLDATVEDASAWLRPLIHQVSHAIDASVVELDARRPLVPVRFRPTAA